MASSLQPKTSDESSAGSQARMWHPALFAMWPILDLYAYHADETVLTEVLPCLVAAAVVAAVSVVLLCRLGMDRHLAGIWTTAGVLMCLGFSALHGTAVTISQSLNITLFARERNYFAYRYMGIVAIVLVAAVWIATRLFKRRLPDVTQFLKVVSVVVCGFAISRVVLAKFAESAVPILHESASSSLATKVHDPDSLPDIYYLIFDRYPNESTLSRHYGFDNTDFVEFLQSAGFQIVENGRCNYPESTMSLSSSMNMRYHGDEAYYVQIVDALRGGNEVQRIVHSLGYQYVHVGGWYSATRTCVGADREILPTRRVSPFAYGVFRMTPFYGLLRTAAAGDNISADTHAETALVQLRSIEEVAADPTRKFVFSHILLPHPPFVFDAEGKRVDAWGNRSPKQQYIEQLRYTNTRIKELVNKIIAGAKRPPIIILQSDEGPHLRGADWKEPLAERVRIRAGVLNAIYYQGGTLEGFQEGITPVNTFRLISKQLFGMDLEPLDDRVFAWGDGYDFEKSHPLVFEDVTELIEN